MHPHVCTIYTIVEAVLKASCWSFSRSFSLCTQCRKEAARTTLLAATIRALQRVYLILLVHLRCAASRPVRTLATSKTANSQNEGALRGHGRVYVYVMAISIIGWYYRAHGVFYVDWTRFQSRGKSLLCSGWYGACEIHEPRAADRQPLTTALCTVVRAMRFPATLLARRNRAIHGALLPSMPQIRAVADWCSPVKQPHKSLVSSFFLY